MCRALMREFDHSFLYDSMSSTCNVGVVLKLFELLHEVEMQMTNTQGFQTVIHHMCFIVKLLTFSCNCMLV